MGNKYLKINNKTCWIKNKNKSLILKFEEIIWYVGGKDRRRKEEIWGNLEKLWREVEGEGWGYWGVESGSG